MSYKQQCLTICAIAIVLLVFLWVFNNEALVQRTPSSVAPATETNDWQEKFCLKGCPIINGRHERVVVHHVFALSNNTETKFADWVAYRVNAKTLGSNCKRVWQIDADLPLNETLKPQDYDGAHIALATDRGHQAPLASLCGSPYWAETNLLSNITPQSTDLNEGAWKRLEDAERRLIAKGFATDVYMITGTLYERDMPSLPNAHLKHRIPSGYWKIFTIMRGDSLLTASFIMDQKTPRGADFCQFQVKLRDIELRAQIRLFPDLTAEAQAKVANDNTMLLKKALGC